MFVVFVLTFALCFGLNNQKAQMFILVKMTPIQPLFRYNEAPHPGVDSDTFARPSPTKSGRLLMASGTAASDPFRYLKN